MENTVDVKRTVSAVTLARLVSRNRKEYQHEYYMKNKDKLNERHKNYYQEHKEQMKEYQKSRYRQKVYGG